jgi:tetratricopeptide (TPR) repeat protein
MKLRRVLVVALGWCAAALAADSVRLTSLLQQFRERPSDWKLCNEIAAAYVADQQFERAAEFYRKVATLNAAFLPARKNLAVVLWFAGRKSEAEPLFRQLVREIPNDPVPHLYLGLANYEREQYVEAARQFSGAGDLAFRNPEVLPAAVDSVLAADDTSAVPAALQFVDESRDTQLALRLATVLNRRGQYTAAIRALHRIESDPEAQLALAEAYEGQKEPQQAYAALTRAIQLAPRNERAYSALAQFASDHQNNGVALEVLDNGLHNIPGAPALLLQKGILLALEGDRDDAERTFRSATAARPSWALPILAVGILQLESARVDEAVATFRRATGTWPEDETAQYLYGLALTRKGDERSRAAAMRVLERALVLKPNDTRARILLGQTYVAAGRVQDGVRELRRGVQADPQNATALYQLSLACRKLGQAAEAEKYLAAFRSIKSKSDSEASEFVTILKVLK